MRESAEEKNEPFHQTKQNDSKHINVSYGQLNLTLALYSKVLAIN